MTVGAVPRFVLCRVFLQIVILEALGVESGWASIATDELATLGVPAHLAAVAVVLGFGGASFGSSSVMLGAADTHLSLLDNARWNTP